MIHERFVSSKSIRAGVFLLSILMLTACQQHRGAPQELASYVDIESFMGDWYVLAHAPTFLDRNAYAAIERYELKDDGRIATTYTFRKGGFDGPERSFHPVGTIYNTETNAEWRMRFFRLFSAPYYILYVDPDYQTTVIGIPSRSMAWIMARQPVVPEAVYEELESVLVEQGYELNILRRVPQQAGSIRKHGD